MAKVLIRATRGIWGLPQFINYHSVLLFRYRDRPQMTLGSMIIAGFYLM